MWKKQIILFLVLLLLFLPSSIPQAHGYNTSRTCSNTSWNPGGTGYFITCTSGSTLYADSISTFTDHVNFTNAYFDTSSNAETFGTGVKYANATIMLINSTNVGMQLSSNFYGNNATAYVFFYYTSGNVTAEVTLSSESTTISQRSFYTSISSFNSAASPAVFQNTTGKYVEAKSTTKGDSMYFSSEYRISNANGLSIAYTQYGKPLSSDAQTIWADKKTSFSATGIQSFTFSANEATYLYQETSNGFQVLSNSSLSNLLYSSGGQLAWLTSALNSHNKVGFPSNFVFNSASSAALISGNIIDMNQSGISNYIIFTVSGGGGGGGGGGPQTTTTTLTGTVTARTNASTPTAINQIIIPSIPSSASSSNTLVGLVLIVFLIAGSFVYIVRRNEPKTHIPKLSIEKKRSEKKKKFRLRL